MASRRVPTHNHLTRDVKALGLCPSCDDFHERRGLSGDEIDEAIVRVMSDGGDPLRGFRLLRMLKDVDPARHFQHVLALADGIALAEQVDLAMGEWPEGR